MVPCQPRQLVIFSLPFAALVAFFWFKRRRSLSRSDPGGTSDQNKPVDKPATTSVTEEDTSEVDISCVKDIQQPVFEEIALNNTKPVSCLSNKVEQVIEPILTPDKEREEKNIKDTLSSNLDVTRASKVTEVDKNIRVNKECIKSIPEANKENLISDRTSIFNFEIKPDFEEVENKLTTPDFELNGVFHSTVIEEEEPNKSEEIRSLNEAKPVQELKFSGETKIRDCSDCKEEYIKDQTEFVDNIFVEKEDLDITLVDIRLEGETEEISLHSQGKLDNTKSFHIGDLVDNSETSDKLDKETIGQSSLVKEIPDIIAVENIENLSADTGLGSQDLSTVEEFQSDMAQGQNTKKSENNVAGLEQKLASLGLDTQQAAAAQRAERDSANHSPAEVMLNSPAISTFSDAHSEGSSDSGKGCSDVVTPPSRTPAGGSSVAGDQVPSIYEFVLPQVIVGRLIGRHGAFLHDIRTKTHTNVFIKRHPETNSLKICAIEGTQPDIDAALKMIRQKFPLRRFPDLTLERVSFVKSSCLPINPENLQLHLVEGVNNDVLVSYMVNAGHLVLQLPLHMSYNNLYRMACIMNTVYNSEESPPLPNPQPDVICVAPASGGWYRAQILSVDEEANTSDVRFMDYGCFLTVDNSLLRQIRGDFMLLPFQAVECLMANIVPAGGAEEWSEAANQFVQSVTSQQILQAQVYNYTDTGLPLVYLYFTQFYQSSTDPSGLESRVMLLNEELVSHGYADLIESPVQEDGQAATTESS